MDTSRIRELEFLIRTHSPVPVTESRTSSIFEDDIYDDFYTIKELIEQEYLEYIGKDKLYQVFVRPRINFSVFVVDEICYLKSGEIITLSLTKAGHTEFEAWIQATTYRNP